jgi:acid stress-induced BolA-like protein IbaG/YrbA
MTNKIMFSMLIFSLLIITACAETATAPVKETPQEPAKVDVVGETSKIKVIVIEEELDEPVETIEEVDKEKGISSEVKELLSKADEEVQSLRYNYKGPETKDFFYEFVVKGNKIKYTIDPTFKDLHLDDDAYDMIYINKEFKTALAYCDGRECRSKGKKTYLDYDEVYILTPLDWLDRIEFAEKIGEEVIGRRNTWKLATNDFTVWIDDFFGVSVRVEFADNTHQFEKMVFNNVKDEEVSVKG